MRHRRVAAVVALSLVPSMLLPGCEGMSSGEKKATGAGAGAVIGGIAGYFAGGKHHRAGGTIIGAVIGGVAGYALAGGFGSDAPAERKQDPNFQQANKEFDAGVQAKNSGDSAGAMQHYQQAQQLAPDQPEPYNNAGLIYLEQGDRANAEASFRKALQVDPNYEPAKTNLQKMGLTA